MQPATKTQTTVRAAASPARTGSRKKPGTTARKFEWTFGLFAVPAIGIYLAFLVGPTVSALYFSLTRWDGINQPTFVGLANYLHLFADPDFRNALLNTILFTIVIGAGEVAAGLGLALLLNRATRGVGAARAVFFAPSLLSSAVVALLWGFIYNSLVGVLPQLARLIGQKASWLTDPLGHEQTALLAVSVVVIWQYAGYVMVIYLAGLKAIPLEIYEAASLDGAGGWQQFRRITWPLLAPATSIVLTIAIAGNLRLFDQVYLLTGGGPAGATETVGTLIFRTAFTNSNYGYSVTQSVVLTVMTAAVVVVQRWILATRER